LGVTSDPEVFILTADSDDVYLLLASDGLWDGLSLAEAAEILSKGESVTDAASSLTQRALKNLQIQQIDDNITALLVDLKNLT
jgi:serine/threonine protein phosphatase PrpC